MTSQIISVLNCGWTQTDKTHLRWCLEAAGSSDWFVWIQWRRGQSWSNYSLFVLISQFNEMKRHPLVLKLSFLASAMLVFWRQKWPYLRWMLPTNLVRPHSHRSRHLLSTVWQPLLAVAWWNRSHRCTYCYTKRLDDQGFGECRSHFWVNTLCSRRHGG